MSDKEARVSDERAFDGCPLIEISGFEERTNERGREQENQETVEENFSPASQLLFPFEWVDRLPAR
jgi:hypothetical protein